MKSFHLRHLVILLLYALIFLEAIPAAVEIKLSTDKKVVCSQQILTCRLTVVNKTSSTICFDKHKLWKSDTFVSVFHPEEKKLFHGDIFTILGDSFDTEPKYTVLKPDKNYSECRSFDLKTLHKFRDTYYKYTVGVGPIYRVSKTGEKKELDKIEIKGVEFKIINCDKRK